MKTKRSLCLLMVWLLTALLPLPAFPASPAVFLSDYRTDTRTAEGPKGLRRVVSRPVTGVDSVDERLKQSLDAMDQEMLDALKEAGAGLSLDTGAEMRRAFSGACSFLMLSRAVRGQEQLRLRFQTLNVDMNTGRALELSDLLDGQKDLSPLFDRVRAELSAYFPDAENREETLGRLCQKDALMRAAFTLETGRLGLHFHASEFEQGREHLVHAWLYYSFLRPFVREEALAYITPPEGAKFLALTFDDGPASGNTRYVYQSLRHFGVPGTFFLVGRSVRDQRDIVITGFDRGHEIGGHSFTHTYKQTDAERQKEVERFRALITGITGRDVQLFRPPGGIYQTWQRCGLPYPLVKWSCSLGTQPRVGSSLGIAARFISRCGDGSVVLIHDTRREETRITNALIELLLARGYLPVTVSELFDLKGQPLTPNEMVQSARPAGNGDRQ